ncbi:MAG: 16S rRNA (cytosine(1402)-N(4))-methyltransferase RsmH [Dehalococcoidia bacterium]|nr:MAG: 16S rRNA (cytosine(1402)-N(4))-methyltransferase RsmH [Dehalococcoidia bacterium]
MLASSLHIPVMLSETIESLSVKAGGRYIDCTIGSGGHAAAIMQQSAPGGQVLGIDADPEAIKFAKKRLRDYGSSILICNNNFVNLETICLNNNFKPVNGILFDLGLSSLQLNGNGRGFSFQTESPLDMRFNPKQSITAANIVNTLTEVELAEIIRDYGQESNYRRIASYIAKERPIKTSLELAKVVERVVGSRRGKIHPATKTFQALRIAVNNELENLELALKQAVDLLGFEGRLVVISYHSLEDRIVKRYFKRESSDCICPAKVMNCNCNHTARLKLINKRVTTPSVEEVKANPRSRSAKLRVVERVVTNEEWLETAGRLCFLGKVDAGIRSDKLAQKVTKKASLVNY